MKKILASIMLILCLCAMNVSAAEHWAKEDTDDWFPVVLIDDTDFKTEETGKAHTDTTVEYSCNGDTAWAAYSDDTNTWKETGDGLYWIQLGATEFADNERCVVRVEVTGAISYRFLVNIADNSQNELVVNVNDIETDTGTDGVVLANDAITAAKIAADAIGSSEIATDAIGAAELAASAIGTSEFAAEADVNSEVDTALADAGLDHLVSAAVTGTDVTDNSIFARLVSSSATADWDTFVNTTDSFQGIRDYTGWDTATGFSTHSAADVADQVWDEATSGHTSAGTFGEQLKTDVDAILADTNELQSDDIPGAISGLNDISTAQVNSEVDTALADINLDHLLFSALPTGVSTDIHLDSALGEIMDAGTSWSYDRSTDALEQISGLAGGTDWSANEITEIKTVLGITNTGTPDNTPSAGALYEIQGATFATGTDSLEAIRNRGDSAWITATGFSTHTAANVWSVGTRALTELDEDNTTIDLDGSTIGTVSNVSDKTGYSISGTKQTLDALNDVTTAAIWTYGTRTTTGGTITTAGTLNNMAQSAVADFFNTDSGTTYGSAVGGSVVAEIADNASATISSGDKDDIVDRVWDEALSGHSTAGTAGKKLDDLPTSGTADFTAGERSLIKDALGITDGDVDTQASLDGILERVKQSRGR